MADENENTALKKNCIKRFLNLIKVNIFGISYVILIIGLWIYLKINWDKCISMKFFDQFDGNNILFLVGIAAIITFFYDVEAKGFKFRRRKNEIMNMEFQSAESVFDINRANILPTQTSNIENNGGNSNEQTRNTDGD